VSWYDLTPDRARAAALNLEAIAQREGAELVVHADGRIALTIPPGSPAAAVLTIGTHLFAQALRDLHAPWRCHWCGHFAELPDGICASCHGLLTALRGESGGE
jgi:hypothetical protein